MGEAAPAIVEPEWLDAPATPAPRVPVAEGLRHGEPGEAGSLAALELPKARLGERLVRFAFGLGVPAKLLTAPFGRTPKPRLLAAVEDPLPGDPARGTALRAGHFLVHGARLPVREVDLAPSAKLAPPVAMAVHGFTWLADLNASTAREDAAPVAERLLGEWLDANSRPPARGAKAGPWTVAHAGTRLLSWLIHAPLILSGERAGRTRALHAIAAHARWLDQHADHAPDKLAEAGAQGARVAAGLLLPAGKPRRLHAEAELIRALGEMVSEDGGVLSRSPIDQMQAITLLVKLRACYRACRRDPPEAYEKMLALLVPPLLCLTHEDGSLGSWQGGWAVGGDEVRALIEASGVRCRPPLDTRHWGYQRVQAQRSVLQVDASPPPLPRHSRHGCASTLAFELSCGDQRLVVNCGGAAAAGGLVPLTLERGLRGTAAHSTLTLDEANSTATFAGGRIGGGVGAVEVDRRAYEGDRLGRSGRSGTRIEASHDGYASRYGLIHRRILMLADDGTELRGEDLLEPASRSGRRRKAGFAIRFHLGPEVACQAVAGGHGAQLTLPDGSEWLFRAAGGEVTIDDSVWVDGAGRPVAIRQLVLNDAVDRSGGGCSWQFTLVG